MNNLLIFGVGLIGGSIAIECQKKQMFNQVLAFKGREGPPYHPLCQMG